VTTISNPPRQRQPAPEKKLVRVAIYTRKSVDKGDGGEFGSIEAQRAAVEAYITSQRGEGWVAIETRYDDLGISGATTARPGFQRLMADMRDGLIDVIAVYKLDRLSRSLADFARLIEVLDEHGVSFVSTTQAFDTGTSAGRLMLNMLMSFAEYERSTTSDRVRDKVHATRRLGMWTGGRPVLGYDSVEGHLVVNADEASQVRAIYALYLKLGSLGAVLTEVYRRGWHNKSWTNTRGVLVVGKPLSKTGIRDMLGNPLYAGKIRLGDEVHEGKHEAIVDETTWAEVQTHLAIQAGQRDKAQRARPHRASASLLGGLLSCGVCHAAMGLHYAARHQRRYSYYVCQTLQKQGREACPGSRVKAADIEAFVVGKIREISRVPELIEATIEQARVVLVGRRQELDEEIAQLAQEAGRLTRERKRLEASTEAASAEAASAGDGAVEARLAEVSATQSDVARQAAAARTERAALADATVDEQDVRSALGSFDAVWDALFLPERVALLRQVLRRVVCNVPEGSIELEPRIAGVADLLDDASRAGEEGAP